MDKSLNIFSFWAVDTLEDTEALKKQLKDMSGIGFGGVVFHPRRYSCDIEYLSRKYMKILTEIILCAKELKMEFWIYDENGWPSGSADGKVLKELPDMKCKWLEMQNNVVTTKEKSAINSLSRECVAKFIELTHEGYKKGLSAEAFEYVRGFFSDEVGFLDGHGVTADKFGVPWSDEIPELFDKKFGGEIRHRLPELFAEGKTDFKIWYWETLTELLGKNFYGQIEKWCADNGKLYTAHLKGEENPFFQIGYSGSCFEVLKNISVPGVDALERYRGNSFYPRIVSSLARQFGSGLSMAEAMGGAGWGLEPADIENYLNWLIDCGINMIVFHINQLNLNYSGITDWPSSIPCHQPWKEAFSAVIERARERVKNRRHPDTLVICAVRGTTSRFAPSFTKGMNEHNGSRQMICESSRISRETVELCERLEKFGVCFDVTDENIFERLGIREGNCIRLGKYVYSKIICAEGCIFTESGKKKLRSVNCMSRADLLSSGKISQTKWDITPPDSNRCLIEITGGRGRIIAEYVCGFKILVSDKPERAVMNSIELELIGSGSQGFLYNVPKEIVNKGENVIQLIGLEKAFAFAVGKFAVKNIFPFYEFDDRQITAKSGFYIARPEKMSRDFIISGYPFSDKPIICEKEISGRLCGYLRISCRYIAAAKVYVNGIFAGWVYKGKECISLGEKFERIKLTCLVYQSAYNLYGPHYHLEGDRPLVSPAQYSGEKNFADSSYLPERTYDDNMKLIKYIMTDEVEVVEKCDCHIGRRD